MADDLSGLFLRNQSDFLEVFAQSAFLRAALLLRLHLGDGLVDGSYLELDDLLFLLGGNVIRMHLVLIYDKVFYFMHSLRAAVRIDRRVIGIEIRALDLSLLAAGSLL